MLISSFKFPNAAPYDLFSFPYCIYSTANFTIDGRSIVFTIPRFDRFPLLAIDVDSFGSVKTQINVNEGIHIEMKNQSLSSFASKYRTILQHKDFYQYFVERLPLPQ